MFCEKCGARVDDGQPFCPNCGNRMGAPAQAPGYAPVAPRGPRAPRPAAGGLDLRKLFMMIAMGLLLLAIIVSFFKTTSTTVYPVDTAATQAAVAAATQSNPGADTSSIVRYGKGETSSSADRAMTARLFEFNIGAILTLALLLLNIVKKNRAIPALVASGVALYGALYVFNHFLATTDQGNADTLGKTTYGFSFWGWLVLIFELAACALCILSCLGELKEKK